MHTQRKQHAANSAKKKGNVQFVEHLATIERKNDKILLLIEHFLTIFLFRCVKRITFAAKLRQNMSVRH